MRIPVGVAGACVALATALSTVVWASPASAHPVDELLQLVYVTPTATEVRVEVELVPGSMVAEAYVAGIDTDADATVSDRELAAHADAVVANLRLEVDGVAVPLRLVSREVPDLTVLRGGGTPIVLQLAATVDAVAGSRTLRITDAYAPMRTTVQASVTLDAARSVEIGDIGHDEAGAGLTVQYRVVGAPARPASTNGSSGVGGSVAAAGAVGGVSLLFVLGARRRGRQRSSST